MSERLDAFLEKEFIAAPYIIGNGMLPVAGKMIVGGAPKANKSFVVLNMMLALAQGRAPFGAPMLTVKKPWRILYLEQELGDQGLLERLKGTDEHKGLINGATVKDLELFVKPRDTQMRLDTPEGRDYIESEVRGARPNALFMDPMGKFHVSDENSAQEMGAVMRVCDHIIQRYGTAIVFTHHTALKIYNPEMVYKSGSRLRGSSAIFADVDTYMEVVRESPEDHPEPTLRLDFDLRRGEPLASIWVQRLRSGKVEWLEGFKPGGGDKEPGRRAKRDRYGDLLYE